MTIWQKMNQAGDTIVEVLVAVSVLGLILGSSYAIVTRSLKASRQAQERGEALKLAEGQLEGLKALSSQKNETIFDSNSVFCIGSGAKVDFPAGYPGSVPDLASDTFTTYPSECNPNDGLYHVAIDAKELSTTKFEFNVYVRWDSLGGTARDEIIMHYRLVKD